MMWTSRLLSTTALRYSLIYFGLFAAAAAIAATYIFWRTNVLLVANLQEAVAVETQALGEQYRLGGVESAVVTIAVSGTQTGSSVEGSFCGWVLI